MPDIWGLAAMATKFLLYLGVLTSAGTVFAVAMFKISGVRAFASIFAAVGLVAAVLGFLLGGAALTGDASGMTDPEMLGLLWATPVGTALAYRFVGLALLIVGLPLGHRGLWASALGGLLALWSFAIVGHIPDRELLWLDALLLIHLIAMAMWVGILTPLRRLANFGAASETADLGQRFGRLAVFFVPLLILMGLVMSYILVGSINALLGTGYGQALIVKVLLVGVLLSLAALNKVRFVPKLMAGEAQASEHLSRSISFEWIAVVAILLTTAILTSVLTLPS
ncbi:CopD family protein [uncultured Tateyamaria sp.]|uniref:copper resistance D family protein n=1 Tax=uncultured Tateyamaria sp. TaxID=455651 RepID=UPI002620F85D|nr:CopD family protein [uncultured Tateyamaria sp.]